MQRECPETERRWKLNRRRTSIKQELSKQTITTSKTIHSPACIPSKWIAASPGMLVTLKIVSFGARCVFKHKPRCLIESLHAAGSLATKLLCVCVTVVCVCVCLAGGTTLSAFGGLPSDHLRVRSAFIKDKRGSTLSFIYNVMTLLSLSNFHSGCTVNSSLVVTPSEPNRWPHSICRRFCYHCSFT